jgi:hypothetical protein
MRTFLDGKLFSHSEGPSTYVDGVLHSDLIQGEKAAALLTRPPDSNGLVQDSSANDRELALYSGRCIVTDGITDYAWFPDSTNFNVAGKTIQISFCIYFAAWPGATSTIFERQGASNGGYWLVYDFGSSAILWISRKAGSADMHQAVRFPRPALGVWNKVTITVTNGQLVSAEINGVSQTLTVVVSPTGTYGDRADRLSVAAWTSGSVTPQSFLAARIADLTFTEGTTLLFRALLNSHASGDLNTLPALDSSGNGLHGTFVNCDGLTAQPHPVPQTAAMDWNKVGRFLGTTNTVTFSGAITLPADFKIEFLLYTEGGGFTTNGYLGSKNTRFGANIDAGAYLWNNEAGTLAAIAGGSQPIPARRFVLVRFERTGSTLRNYINNLVSSETGTLTGDFIIDRVGTCRGQDLGSGYILNLKIDIGNTGAWDHSWLGYSDRAWINQIGAINGTWNASPQQMLPLVSEINSSLDALGNAISLPRPHPAFLNFPEQGESGVITTVPAVKTFSFWCYWDGSTAKKLIDLGTPEINVSALGVVSTAGITSPTIYVDGVASTALTVGHHQITVTSATAFDCTPVTADNPSGDHLFYTVAQSAGQILRNFKATRKRYS